MTAAVIIPFRDRGVDPLRQANLDRVVQHWKESEFPVIVADDGRTGGRHFNRSAAYNRGTAQTDADVFIYAESDIMVDFQQIREAIEVATVGPGMVIPFTEQRKLTEDDSVLVRSYLKDPQDCVPGQVIPTGLNGINHGCCNVISRATLKLVGQWDEKFEGHGHDDTAMLIAFDRCAGNIRWVQGVAYHLYHLEFDPTLSNGSHITAGDAQAQARNLQRLNQYRKQQTAEGIRWLTAGGGTDWRTRVLPLVENDPLAGRYRA